MNGSMISKRLTGKLAIGVQERQQHEQSAYSQEYVDAGFA